MKSSLQQAWHHARAQFLSYDGVVGVGYGPKIKGGEEVVREAIIIFVDRKRRPRNVDREQFIPDSFDGFPTDVREPRLNTSRGDRFDAAVPPDDPSDECLTDNEWIDWGKIHRLNVEQRAPEPDVGDDAGDVPTTEVIGNIFVIRDPSMTLVTTVGTSQTIDYVGAYNLLRGTFADDYDFVSFYIDVGSGLPDIGNASSTVFNSTTGIGLASINNRSTWGSSRLLRRINHTWFSLRTLMHEPAHQWLFYVDYRETAGGTTQDLLHQDWAWDAGQRGFHWGRWPDNDNSSLDYDRADWTDNANGTFNRARHFETTAPDDVWFGFNTLDQHLMGLAPASEVASTVIVRNPSPAQSDATPGPYTPSPSPVTVGIANIQYEEGTRSPDHLNSQRVFHHAIVVLTASSASPLSFASDSETWRTSYTDRFRAATAGRLVVDTSLLRANHQDLYVKDNPSDTGQSSSTGPFWASPDLWVRNADDNGTDHQCPIRGQQNWIYVRVRNRGALPYPNVAVNVYLGNFATLTPGTEFVYPDDWDPAGLVNSATLASVPAAAGGVDGEMIAKIAWPAPKVPPAAGWHPCLLAEVIPMTTSPITLHHVWDNKKIAQRNLTIIDPGQGCPPISDSGDLRAYAFESRFVIGNAARPAQPIELRIELEDINEHLLLFLDPAGLVDDIETVAPDVQLPVPFLAGRALPDEQTVQAITPLTHPAKALLLDAAGRHGEICGNTLLVPAGTRVALLPGCQSKPDRATTWIHFCDDARLVVGYRTTGALERRYSMRGLQPVLLNGLPLLLITEQVSRLTLTLNAGERRTLKLLGVVSPYRGHHHTTSHISEVIGGAVVGGIAIQIGS